MSSSLYFTEYHPNVPKNCTRRHFDVGPFMVHVSNKGHYRLYTSELDGVVFLKQASYPSIDQLHHDLTQAITEKKICSSIAAPYLEACLPLLNRPKIAKTKYHKIPDAAILAKKKGR